MTTFLVVRWNLSAASRQHLLRRDYWEHFGNRSGAFTTFNISLSSQGHLFFCLTLLEPQIHESVRPLSTEPVITKNFPNSFHATDLLERLKADNVGSLLICGMMSHMCVDATVRAAFDLGFSCILTHDACATRELTFNGITVPAAQVHASYMAALGAVYAQVKSVDEILENMSAAV